MKILEVGEKDFPDVNLVNSRILIDIKPQEATEDLGKIKNSILIPFDRFEEEVSEVVDKIKSKFSKNDKLAIVCEKGVDSIEVANELKKQGYDAISLKGGFYYLTEVLNLEVE